MLNFVNIREEDDDMDKYEEILKKFKECKKDMSDDEVAWVDMGGFEIGMNKGLIDLLTNIDEPECYADEDPEAADRFKKYLEDLKHTSATLYPPEKLQFKPQKCSFVDPRFTEELKKWADKDTCVRAKEDDAVNHPKHYTSGKYECLAVMVDTFGVEAVKNFCKCNAFKYTWRSDKKNGTEDIKKASFYLKFLEGLEEGKSAEEILKNIHG
jgi:hypothetical protein